jgi:hypothetical protein
LPFGPGRGHKIPVRQRFQELHDLVLFSIGRGKVANLPAEALINFRMGSVADPLSRLAGWFMHASGMIDGFRVVELLRKGMLGFLRLQTCSNAAITASAFLCGRNYHNARKLARDIALSEPK